MARDRQSLNNLLLSILGSPNVYFQPPATMKLVYPCIIYKLDEMAVVYASNSKYFGTKKYFVTVVDRNPDSLIPDKIFNLQYCTFEGFNPTDGLNQYMYSLHW